MDLTDTTTRSRTYESFQAIESLLASGYGRTDGRTNVFLSHSGKQKNFVQQLFRDLTNQGISCVFGEDRESLPLDKGSLSRVSEVISSCKEVVSSCQVAVLLLSHDYMEEKWPMQELSSVMVEMLKNPSLKILPIYLLIPLNTLETIPEDNKKCKLLGISVERQAKWFEALKDISRIDGLMFREGDNEVKFIDKIVKEIWRILPRLSQRYDVPRMQRKERMCQEVADFITTVHPNEKGIRIAGSYGPRQGTIFWKTFCNFQLRNFEGKVCHLDVSGGDPFETRKLALQYLTQCPRSDVQALTSQDQAEVELYRRLQGRRVLLVLDHITVERIEDVTYFLNADLGENSCILLSARSKDVLVKHFNIDAQSCMSFSTLTKVGEMYYKVDGDGNDLYKLLPALDQAFDHMPPKSRTIFMLLTVYMLPDMSPDKIIEWMAIICNEKTLLIEKAVVSLVENGFIEEFKSEILVDDLRIEFAQWKANKMDRWLWWKEEDDHRSTRGIIAQDKEGFESAKFEQCMYRQIDEKYLGNLFVLQLVDVKSMSKLELGSMKRLRSITLRNCKDLKVLDGMENCCDLAWLQIIGVNPLFKLPELSSLESLQYLELWNMEKLMELPTFTRLSNLTVLKLGNLGTRDPPDLTGCERLEDVYFFTLKFLERFPDFSSLRELKKLSLYNCIGVQDPPHIDGCLKLQVFHLLYNDNMKGLPKMDKCILLEEIKVSWHCNGGVTYEGIDPDICQVEDDLEFSLEHFKEERFGNIGDVSMPEELEQLQWLKGKTMLVKRYFRGVKLYYSLTTPYEGGPSKYCSKNLITLKMIYGEVTAFMKKVSDSEDDRWLNKVREYFKVEEDIALSDLQQADSWTSIRPQLSQAPSNNFKVLQVIRDLAFHSEAYDPKRVALGICNHRVSLSSSETKQEKVNMAQEKVNMAQEKVKALCTTANRVQDMTVESLVAEIQRLDQQIRDRYEYIGDGLSEEILAWNFAMDACFILEFFRSSYRLQDHIVEREIMIDIFKMENQIPLFILRKILELEFETPEKTISEFAGLMCMHPQFAILPFSLKPVESKCLKKKIEANIKEDPCHLLHLLSKTIEASIRPSNVPIGQSGVELVSDLADFIFAVLHRDVDIGQKFLIRFKPSRDGQIQFKKGWFGSCALYLPQIYLCEETEPLFWNLIAFASRSENNIIGHFIFFMNWIIGLNGKTIAVLKKKQIITSRKSDAELSKMFDELSKIICKSCGAFDNIQSQIEENCSSSFNKWMLWFTCLLFQFPFVGLILLFAFGVSIFVTRW